MNGRPAKASFVLVLALAALSAAFAEGAASAPPPATPQAAANKGEASAKNGEASAKNGEASANKGEASANKGADAKPADLKEARARLAAASSPAEYAALLDSFSTSLPPPDALALLDQGSDGAAQAYRKPLLVKAADLSLLLGLFGEAASRYEAAASLSSAGLASGPKDSALLLRAARCSIAAGDADKAQALAADLIVSAAEPDIVVAARLVGAWALVAQGRPDDASALAAAVAGASKGSPSYPGAERSREARFLLWLCAGVQGKAQAAALLASEFPGSPEALIAAGSASPPPLPHWYLGGLGAARATSAPRPPAPLQGAAPPRPPVESKGSAAPTPGPSTAAAATAAPASTEASATAPPASADPASSAKGKRLQVGYFSREDNAQALKAELASKGFAAVVETRIRAAAPGKAEEKRWIVVVEGGKDRASTLQSLKDAGYESYVID